MENKDSVKVTLVGAGPGSYDLLTIRGLRAIENADIILYDALVSNKILEFAHLEVPKIYVGKRSGSHGMKQEEINNLLLQSTSNYTRIVRLKGGDPMVFGRATEEIEFLENYGINVEVVPGVSSALAAPTSQGIPLTKRGVSSSFWVVTGTLQNGNLSPDIQCAARSNTTMVVLMGLRKIREICEIVKRYRGENEPMAVIQNGTLSNESCEVGTINRFMNEDVLVDTSKPGILVVGEVVKEHPDFYGEEVIRVLHSYI